MADQSADLRSSGFHDNPRPLLVRGPHHDPRAIEGLGEGRTQPGRLEPAPEYLALDIVGRRRDRHEESVL